MREQATEQRRKEEKGMEKQSMAVRKKQEARTAQAIDLGKWMGRREAFAVMAGRCSAADAVCLRKIRDEKSYRTLKMTWTEFCQQRLGIARSTAETMIHQLEEFGPAYFTLAQLTGVSAADYRRIATAVSGDRLLAGGEEIAFAPENAKRLVTAVEELRAAHISNEAEKAAAEAAANEVAEAAEREAAEAAAKVMPEATEKQTAEAAEKRAAEAAEKEAAEAAAQETVEAPEKQAAEAAEKRAAEAAEKEAAEAAVQEMAEAGEKQAAEAADRGASEEAEKDAAERPAEDAARVAEASAVQPTAASRKAELELLMAQSRRAWETALEGYQQIIRPSNDEHLYHHALVEVGFATNAFAGLYMRGMLGK
jgi:hypothetical protein